jgi:DNA-binding beta-propeller fold protein YncE
VTWTDWPGNAVIDRSRSMETVDTMKISRAYGRTGLLTVLAALSVAYIGSCTNSEGSGPPLPLEHVADLPLDGNPTRLDYASFDPSHHLLFIAHLGDSAVIVFDTQAQRIVSRIDDVSHVHGVLVIPELNKVYATATGTDEIVAIDETSLRITARIPDGVYPDGMAYAPKVRRLYVSDEDGSGEAVVDVTTDTRIMTIPLGGDIGNTQYDAVSGHIFANVQTSGQLVEIDPVVNKIVDRIDLPGAKGNHGLFIDSDKRLAFIACEDNNKLLVLDLQTKKVITSFDVGGDPDVLAFDPVLNYLYVASETGVVSLFHVQSDAVTKIGEGLLAPNAHVVAVDASTHKSYFPLKNLDGRPVLRIMEPKH